MASPVHPGSVSGGHPFTMGSALAPANTSEAVSPATSGIRLTPKERNDIYFAEILFYLVLASLACAFFALNAHTSTPQAPTVPAATSAMQVIMILAQTVLYWWKRKHQRSYALVGVAHV